MKKHVAQIGLLLSVLSPVTWASDASNVRFDVHRSGHSYVLVARGAPGVTASELYRALSEKEGTLCQSAKRADYTDEHEYDFLDGGASYILPAGGAFVGRTAPHVIRRARAVETEVSCAKDGAVKADQPQRALRVYIRNGLGDTISYVDQGFASFNRHSLDVPVKGEPIQKHIASSILAALRERGYDAEMADSPESSDLEFSVSKITAPEERFGGVVLMTKIGLLGIEKASYAFCSIRLDLMRHAAKSAPVIASHVSTRAKIPAAYADWEKDMANGPSPDLHAKTSDMLMQALAVDLKALVHTIPADALEMNDSPTANAANQ